MSDFVLSCCSTADLSIEFLKEKDIKYCCFHYWLNDEEHSDDMWQSMSPDEFYSAMSNGADTKTSQINADEFEEYFEQFLSEGKDILHLTLSSGISGVCNSALIAKNNLLEKYPDRKIYIIDSLGASSGYGLIMATLADMRDAGSTIDELADFAEEHKLNMHHWFFSMDLTFYVKGGRVTKTAGFVGNMLNICPLLNMDNYGRLIPRFKIRTKKKVIATTVEQMVEHADDGVNYNKACFISHSGCPDDAEATRKSVEEKFPNLKGKVKIFPIGTTIGSHTGPGTVALFFWGDKRVD